MDEIAENNTNKQENEENISGNNVNNDLASQACSNIISSPKLKCSTDQNVKKFMFSSVLRPSQLNGNVSSSPTKPAFSLNPSKLNPFAKASFEDNSNNRDDQKDASVVTSSGSSSSSSSSTAPKFLPLLQNGSKSEPAVKTITPSTSAVSSNNFVFGQNLKDRVISDTDSGGIKFNNCTNTNGSSDTLGNSNLKAFQSEEDSISPSCSRNANGTSDMLFSSALKETPALENNPASKPQNSNKSLSESAREYEESRAVKRKYEEVEVKTGEEEETNVLQIMCKLFAFDKNSGGSWQERGRGTLRLNDAPGNAHSRLVFRTAGSLRVVLNTKIWAEMTIQRASDKSIRLTAFDYSGEIKVFLLTGTPEDIKQLQKHLEVRLKKEMDKHKTQSLTDNLTSNTANHSLEPEAKRLSGESKSNN